MTTPVTLIPPTGSSLPNPSSRPTDIRDAAKQFEALLIAEMLKATHQESSGWLGDSEDAAGQQAIALAEEHLANALASQGGLGLACTIERQLNAVQNHNRNR